MRKSRVNRKNYVVIQGWMITDLLLKGNELVVYAIIYNFTQAENQKYTGSLQYLSDWTNSSKQGVIKCLKSLVEKGYIKKIDKYVNSVKFCEYYATEFNEVCNKVDGGIQQSLIGGVKQSLPNNKDIDIKEDIKEDNNKNIIEFLNLKAGTQFRHSSKANQKHINARLNEGFTVDDFKRVIENKVNSWKGTDYEKYLRPETLFGNKFESYLNEKQSTKTNSRYCDIPEYADDLPY